MFEKKRGKRFLASVMALVMLLSLAPVGALAADGETLTNEECSTVNQPAVEGGNQQAGADEDNNTPQPAVNPKPVVAAPVESSSEAVILPEGDPFDQDFAVNPPEPREPSTQYERLYVTILNGTEFPNEPGFSHKYGYDFVKRNDDGGYSIEAYNQASYSSNQQVFSTQAGNFIKVNAFNAAGLTTNGNVKGLYNANGIDLTEYTTFTESDANAIAAAYASYKNLETGATYKLVPYVLKYEDHGTGWDAPSTGYHLDCIVVKDETVLVKYDMNGATTAFQLPDNTYVVPRSDVTIGSWKNSSGTTVADNSITAQKNGKDVTFVGWSTNPNANADSQDLYKAGNSLQNINAKTTLYAIWKEKEESNPNPPTDTVEAKYFVLMPSANAPSSGNDQGKENYFPSERTENGTKITDDGGVEGASRATGYAGKITQDAADLVKNKGDDGYFEATGVEDTYLAQKPTNLGYFDANNYNKEGTTWTYAGHGNLPATLTAFTMEGKEVVWYVIKNVGTETKPDYHVDGYVKGVDIKVTYHQNFDGGTSWTEKNLKSGDPVTIKNYTEVWENSSREGYTFTGWNTKADGTGDSYAAGDKEVLKTSIDLYAQWEQNYTVIFDANGGSWSASIPGYTIDTSNPQQAVKNNLTVGDRISDVKNSLAENDKFLGWAATDTAPQEDAIVAFSIMSPTVAQLKDLTKTNGHTITLYAIWSTPRTKYTYTIQRHFMNKEGVQDGEPEVRPSGTAEANTLISTLIPSNLTPTPPAKVNGSYIYEASATKVNGVAYTESSALTEDNTVIDLYYYLDNWKDGKGNNPDSKTDGDGIPDYKQILVEYHAIPATEGTVTPAVEVHTLDANKTPITLDGSKAEKVATSNFVFAYWISGNVDNSKTADQIEAGAISYNAQLSGVQVTPKGGETYIYTAIFLKDVVGNPDGPDGIPDIWQYKVTFNVDGGNWNDTNNNNEVVRYVTRAKGENNIRKAVLGDVPVAGEKPDASHINNGSWTKDDIAMSEAPKVGDEITGPTNYVFTYNTATPVTKYTYTVNRNLMGATGAKVKTEPIDTNAKANEGTILENLITPDMRKNWTEGTQNYVYVPAATTFKKGEISKSGTDTLDGNDFVIDLYYYLDNWKDADNTTDKDSATSGDGIPDCDQVLIKYVSSNSDRGTVSPDMEVLTIRGSDKQPTNKGTVTASGSTATVTGSSRNYFSNWTNNAGLATSSTAKLGQQTFTTEGGKTYTFTANFGYSGGGGSGGSSRPSTPPTVDIPDDVPTGLNGKDHYAYIIGYGNNDVRPQNNITRAEVATIFFRLLTDETREANMTKSNGYNDVKDGDWFCCAVSTLSKMGIIKGYEDGSFKPNDPISRAEFAAIAARFDPDGDKTPASFADVTSHWAKDEISIAANHGWIKGYEDGSFKPDQKITRAETMTLVNRVLNRLPEAKDDLHKDMKTWVDNMDETAWYYLAVQEATNSHYFKNKTGTKFEQWTDLRDTRDWSELEK